MLMVVLDAACLESIVHVLGLLHPHERNVDVRKPPRERHGALCIRRESWQHRARLAGLSLPDVESLPFATIDYSDDTPVAYVGTYVELEQLAARNLRRFEGW